MAFLLHIVVEDGPTLEVDLTARLPAILGRDSDQATVVIPDPQVSRAHCRVSEAMGGLLVEDLGSRNGTSINDTKITKGIFTAKDQLHIGVSTLTIRAAAPPDPLKGTTIGNYHLQEVIGSGSYGTVYRALQLNLARPVAVKVLSQEYASDPQRVQAFLTEAGRAGRLNHPNLVQVHDVVAAMERYFLVMELMHASTGDLLADEGTFAEDRLLIVMRDTARALAYADSQRIVHRDIKPDNILVNEEGTYKVADLGIATSMNREGVAVQDRIFGSPPYVAPEQAKGLSIDGRADLYALGASLWHLAVGQTLFNGTSKEMVNHHLYTPPGDLAALAPQLSKEVVAFILNLLEKDPTNRPPHAAEAVRQIELLMASRLHHASLPTVTPAKPRQMRRIRSIRGR
jgi:serine/threonine protein kinase